MHPKSKAFMLRLSISSLNAAAKWKPAGYVDRVIASGEVDGEWVLLSEPDYLDLCLEFSGSKGGDAAGDSESISSRAYSAAISGARWLFSGAPIVNEATHLSRSVQCSLCPRWDAHKKKCQECGCYGAKHWMATESCPLGRW